MLRRSVTAQSKCVHSGNLCFLSSNSKSLGGRDILLGPGQTDIIVTHLIKMIHMSEISEYEYYT